MELGGWMHDYRWRLLRDAPRLGIPCAGNTEGNAGRRPVETVARPVPCAGGAVADGCVTCSDLVKRKIFSKVVFFSSFGGGADG